MKTQLNQRWQSLLLASIATIILLGASVSVFAQKGIGKDYGARDPHVCKNAKNPTKGAPSPMQAAIYVACEREHVQSKLLYLVEDVKVNIGGGRPFSINSDPYLTDADTNSPVYPIRGSFKEYQCEPQVNNPSLPQYNNVGKNCTLREYPNATGKCWKTTFGDWRCDMTSDTQNRDPDPQRNVAPPQGNTKTATTTNKNQPVTNTPNANDVAPNNNAANQQTTNDNSAQNVKAANGDTSGFPAPETLEMSPYFDVLKFKYDLNQGLLIMTVKTKADSGDRPHNGWMLHYYDEDGIEIWQTGMLELNSNLNSGQTETFRVPLLRESDLKRTKRVVVTKYVN